MVGLDSILAVDSMHMTNADIYVSMHVRERMRERITLPPDTSEKHLVHTILAMWNTGVPYGGQFHNGTLRLCTHDRSGERVVLAAREHPSGLCISTLFTEQQAIANQRRMLSKVHGRMHMSARMKQSRGTQLSRRRNYKRRDDDLEDDE